MKEEVLSRRRLIASATATGLVVAGGGPTAGTPGGSQRALAQGDSEDQGPTTPTPFGSVIPEELSVEMNWAFENYNLSGTRDVAGSSISTSSIDQLGDAWALPVEVAAPFGALTANPIIAGDVVYIQDAAANVYALNKETGEQLWTTMYNDDVPSGGPNGIAAAYGRLYTTAGGVGDVVALHPESGIEVWRTNIKGPLDESITTAPLVYDNRVFVSTIPASSEGFYLGGQRGLIYALDAATGQVLWYFDTTTDNLWGNPTVNSGGGFWHPPSVDEEGKLYVPIANPGPYPGTEGWPWASSRPGDNLYTDSILKMDPRTATLDWYYQVKSHDLFDLDNQLTPILADVDGRKLVFTSGKHGVVYALDRDTSELVWRTPVGTHQNDERTEIGDDEILEVWPGTFGGVETQFAYSLANNLVILPVVELPSTYIGTGFDPNTPFEFFGGTGLLVALNGSDGSVAWQVELATPPYAAATITNDIVFTAGLDGLVLGFNVTDGSEVFRYQATCGINAPFAASGDYLYVPAGGPLTPSSASTDPPVEAVTQVIALKIGGTVQVTPEAGAGGEANPKGE